MGRVVSHHRIPDLGCDDRTRLLLPSRDISRAGLGIDAGEEITGLVRGSCGMAFLLPFSDMNITFKISLRVGEQFRKLVVVIVGHLFRPKAFLD